MTLALGLHLFLLHTLNIAFECINAVLERLHVLLLLFHVRLLREHDGAVELRVAHRRLVQQAVTCETLIHLRVHHRTIHPVVFIVVICGRIRPLVEVANRHRTRSLLLLLGQATVLRDRVQLGCLDDLRLWGLLRPRLRKGLGRLPRVRIVHVF